ncbi:hypothetical protein [Streptomyces sp. NPDC059176]|uniref:hypothetical protein n=1 Tax=Streptomyces sp. NPDC059176 TaxID=3346758 RepID=UPI0036CCFC05
MPRVREPAPTPGTRAGAQPGTAKTPGLSRHWRLAVITAAGLATVTATTAALPAADSASAGAENARAHAAARVPAQAAAARAGAGPAQDGDRDEEYWARHAGNPDQPHTSDTGKPQQGKAEEGKAEDGQGKGGGGGDGRGMDDPGGGEGGDGRGEGRASGHSDRDEGPAVPVDCDPNALIAAITAANQQGGGRLSLAPHCTYTLTANDGGNGLPVVVQHMAIDGNGATIARAANADQFRIFNIGSGGDLKLRHLTVTRGKTAEDENGGGAYVGPAGRLTLDCVTFDHNTVDDTDNDDGGAIYNEGVTTIRNTTLSNNSANEGGAVSNDNGKLEITTSRITGNTAANVGGGIDTDDGTTTISKSLLKNNYSGSYGGAVDADGGQTEIDDSVLVYNVASSGGGGAVDTDSSLFIRRSTIAHNTTPRHGGALELDSPAMVEDSRIYDNTATGAIGGGGIYTSPGIGDTVSIRRTVISGNQAPGNGASGGGIYTVTSDMTLDLTDTRITDNTSDDAPGGIDNTVGATVNAYGTNTIVDNVPTNCTGVDTTICFG